MKKNFVLPKLSISKDRWLIEWHATNPDTGKISRIQRTFDLNKIKNLKDRRNRANEIIHEITPYIPLGYPFFDIPRKVFEPKQIMKLHDAVVLANKHINAKSDRPDTERTNNSFFRAFIKWITENKLNNILLENFTKSMAMQFVEHNKKVSNRTKNNYRAYGVSIWKALKYLEVTEKNPFETLERKKVTRQQKMLIDNEDRKIIFDYIRTYNPELLLTLQIEYYCLLRPKEIRFMKIKHLDFINNCIHVTPDYAKKSSGTPSVPIQLMNNLKVYRKYPSEYYVFGKSLKPGKQQMGHNYMNTQFKEVLKYLYEEGMIKDYSHITFYDMKRAGITDMLNNEMGNFTHIEVMNQARHTDIKTTLLYYTRPKTNKNFHNIEI